MSGKPTYKELEHRVKELEKKVIFLNESNKAHVNRRRTWRETFDAINDWVSLIDLDHRILISNRAGEIMLGLSNVEIVGQTCYSLLHGKKVTIENCPFQRTIVSHQREDLELQMPDGSWKLISVDPIFDDDGNLSSAVHIVRDISEIKKIEQKLINSEKKYRTLYENASEGIFLLDINGVIVDGNPQIFQLLGYDKQDIKGKKVIDFIHPNDLRTTPFIFSEMVNGQTVMIERRIRKKDNRYIHLEANARRIPDDLVLVFYRDTTERRKTEDALRASKKNLKQKTKTLEETNRALSVLLDHRSKEKSRFERNILDNVKKLVIPYLEQMKKTKKKKDILDYLNIVERNLKEITSAFSTELTSKHIYLTQTEIQIANLIKMGKTSKEIAPLMGVTPKTVFFHRENIRKKLGLTHRKINLKSYLQTIL